jgi:hypothetical protein
VYLLACSISDKTEYYAVFTTDTTIRIVSADTIWDTRIRGNFMTIQISRYRTEAEVYDNEMGKVGKALGMGQSVVHGWMSAALGGRKTSAVTVCGHDDDTIFDIANIGKPGCLQIWWYS